MKKLLASILFASTCIAATSYAAGLYFVSGGDFRTPMMAYTVETSDNNQSVELSPYYWSDQNNAPTAMVEKGVELPLTYKVESTYTFPSIGTHKVKIYCPNDSYQLFSFNSSVSKQNKTITDISLVNCTICAPYTTSLTNLTIKGTVSFPNTALLGSYVEKINILDDSLTTIGVNAFAFSRLKSFTVPDSVTTINQAAFAMCSYLSSITLPNKNISIDYSILKTSAGNFTSIFRQCPIVDVYFNGTLADWNANETYVYIFGAPGETANEDGTYTLQYSSYAQEQETEIANATGKYTTAPAACAFQKNSKNGKIKLHLK